MGITEFGWNKGDTVRPGDYNFIYGKGNKNHELGTRHSVYHTIVSAVTTVESVSDRMSYVVMKGHWCNISDLNVHAPSEEKVMIQKIQKGQIFYHFPKYHMKILLGDFNAKMGIGNIFKPTIRIESLLNQDSNDNGARIINFATSKNLVVRTRCFRTKTFTNTPGPLLMGILTTRLIT